MQDIKAAQDQFKETGYHYMQYGILASFSTQPSRGVVPRWAANPVEPQDIYYQQPEEDRFLTWVFNTPLSNVEELLTEYNSYITNKLLTNYNPSKQTDTNTIIEKIIADVRNISSMLESSKLGLVLYITMMIRNTNAEIATPHNSPIKHIEALKRMTKRIYMFAQEFANITLKKDVMKALLKILKELLALLRIHINNLATQPEPKEQDFRSGRRERTIEELLTELIPLNTSISYFSYFTVQAEEVVFLNKMFEVDLDIVNIDKPGTPHTYNPHNQEDANEVIGFVKDFFSQNQYLQQINMTIKKPITDIITGIITETETAIKSNIENPSNTIPRLIDVAKKIYVLARNISMVLNTIMNKLHITKELQAKIKNVIGTILKMLLTLLRIHITKPSQQVDIQAPPPLQIPPHGQLPPPEQVLLETSESIKELLNYILRPTHRVTPNPSSLNKISYYDRTNWVYLAV
jgi:hypothetical protein